VNDHPLDELTGLPGRWALDTIDIEFSARHAGDAWSCLLIDIDDFQSVNEKFGRLTGDRILQQVAYLLSRNIKSRDEAVRYGGDEFLVVLPSTGMFRAANVAQRLIESLDGISVPEGHRLTLSMGIAESSDQLRRISEVAHRAAEALARSKAAGRGVLSFHGLDGDEMSVPSFDHFVNRQEELRVLRDALDETMTGGARAVIVTGEPGSGKTRLVNELRHFAAYRGALFTMLRLDQEECCTRPTLLSDAALQLIDSLDGHGRATLSSTLPPVSRSTADLFRSLNLVVASLDGELAGDPGIEAGMVVNAVASVRPVVLLVDDLQKAGLEGLRLLGRVMRTARDAKLLIVMTMRTPVERFGRIWKWLETHQRFIPMDRLPLPLLRREFASSMVQLALRTPVMPGESVAALLDRTGGNPLFIELVLMNLAERGMLSSGDGSQWHTPASALRSRMEALRPPCRDVLKAAAAAGCSAVPEVLGAMTGLPHDEIVRAVDELRALGFLQGAETRSIRFRSEHVREMILESVPRDELQDAHRAMGDYFASLSSRGAHHLIRCAARSFLSSGSSPRAMEYCLLAAEDARRRGCDSEQAEWLEHYTELLSTNDPLPGTSSFRAWLTLGLLQSRPEIGVDPEAALSRASMLADTHGEAAEAAWALGVFYADRFEFDRAYRHLEQALETPDRDRQTMIRTAMARIRHLAGDTSEAASILAGLEAEIPDSPSAEDSPGRLSAEAALMAVCGEVYAAGGNPGRGADCCRRAIFLAGGAREPERRARAMTTLAEILARTGGWEESLRLLSRASDILSDAGDMRGVMTALRATGEVLLDVNQVDAAEEHARRCMELAEVTETKCARVAAGLLLGRIAERRGDSEEALRSYSRSLELGKLLGYGRMAQEAGIRASIALARLGSTVQAERMISGLQPAAVQGRMGACLRGLFHAASGTVAFLARTGPDSPENALACFRAARAVEGGMSLMEDMEATWMEAQCLMELSRPEKAAPVVLEACREMETVLETVESPFLRNDLTAIPAIAGLFSLRGALQGPPAPGAGGP
jgi:diguanylate cyclase (GGDEF)-like protein